jgi:hypothetical protein
MESSQISSVNTNSVQLSLFLSAILSLSETLGSPDLIFILYLNYFFILALLYIRAALKISPNISQGSRNSSMDGF